MIQRFCTLSLYDHEYPLLRVRNHYSSFRAYKTPPKFGLISKVLPHHQSFSSRGVRFDIYILFLDDTYTAVWYGIVRARTRSRHIPIASRYMIQIPVSRLRTPVSYR